MKLELIGVAAAVVLLAGCAGGGSSGGSYSSSDAAATTNFKHSGFLSDYSRLKPVEGLDGSFRYIDTSANLKPYTKLLIEPVQIFMTPNPEYQGLQPDAMKRMTDAFQSSFQQAVASGYQVVSNPGPDVLRIRMAITGVQATKPALGVTDFIPIKAIFNVARDASGNAPMVAEMSAEFEMLDPKGQVVAAAVSTRKSEKTLPQGEKITWNDLSAISNAWARNLRTQLDLARGVAAK